MSNNTDPRVKTLEKALASHRLDCKLLKARGFDSLRHMEYEYALDGLARENKRYREALARIQAFQPNRIESYRQNGIVFRKAPMVEWRPPRTSSPWEDVAFWTYTDLCEIEAIARQALTDEEDP